MLTRDAHFNKHCNFAHEDDIVENFSHLIHLRLLAGTILLSLILSACGPRKTTEPVTPISYRSTLGQLPHTIGKLRRLAFLPVIENAPNPCRGGGEKVYIDQNESHVRNAVYFLTNQRGYEVIVLDEQRIDELLGSIETNGSLSKSVKETLLEEIVRWSSRTDNNEMPPPLLRSLVDQVRERDQVDGLLVLNLRWGCMADLTVNKIMTFGWVVLFPSDEQINQIPSYYATLLETASARPVFVSDIGHYACAIREKNLGEKDCVIYVLSGLEPALPKVLAK